MSFFIMRPSFIQKRTIACIECGEKIRSSTYLEFEPGPRIKDLTEYIPPHKCIDLDLELEVAKIVDESEIY